MSFVAKGPSHQYCSLPPPAALLPLSLRPYEQCGGQGSSCTSSQCSDAYWPSSSCPLAYSCIRQSQWYWQCKPALGLAVARAAATKAGTVTAAAGEAWCCCEAAMSDAGD